MISTTLNDYPRVPVKDYSQRIKQLPESVTAYPVDYTYRGKRYQYKIPVTTTQPNYGGLRYWWRCPKCNKRVAVLYCAGYCVCRHCLGVKYQTQHLQPIDRQFKRVAILRQRLGWYGGVAHGTQGKPKGMHFRTYYRLLGDYHHTANKVLQMTLDQLPKGIGADHD